MINKPIADVEALQYLIQGANHESILSLLKKQFSEIVNENIERESVANSIFTNVIYYSGNEAPEIPIENYFSILEGSIRIWANAYFGGIQYNELCGWDTFRFRPFRLEGKGIWKNSEATVDNFIQAAADLIKEINTQSQSKAFSVVAEALNSAETQGRSHIIPPFEKGKFEISDINRLKILHKRINLSANLPKRVNDLFVSHEVLEEIRKWSYSATPTPSFEGVSLPTEVLESVFKSGIDNSIWDMMVHEVPEGLFDPNLIFATDNSSGSFVRAMRKEDGVVFFSTYRESDVSGFEGSTEESWVIGDSRALVGLRLE